MAAHLCHAVTQQQDDPLTRLLYAASTGDAKRRGGASPAPGDAVGLARSVHAAQVAADVVRSVADPSGSWLTQDLVGTLSQDAALPTRIRNKLIKLALSTSQKTIVERRAEGFDAMGDPVAKLPPWSLRILMADNVGFRCMKTYEQFVALAILVVPYDVLVKLGVIAASKVSRSLVTELPDAASYLARTIDYGCLAFRTAERLKSLLAITDLFDDDGASSRSTTLHAETSASSPLDHRLSRARGAAAFASGDVVHPTREACTRRAPGPLHRIRILCAPRLDSSPDFGGSAA
mmetsp:Transcript_17451/g.62027  ORF Transcript_17451/g.62027 Transcript_17451/m.62027 type:complete len:291 (-) Transcript_17451:24-896(-)